MSAATKWALAQTAFTPNAKALLIALAAMADRDNRVETTQAELAGIMERGTSSVKEGLALLENIELIERERRPGVGPTIITLTMQAITPPRPAASEGWGQ